MSTGGLSPPGTKGTCYRASPAAPEGVLDTSVACGSISSEVPAEQFKDQVLQILRGNSLEKLETVLQLASKMDSQREVVDSTGNMALLVRMTEEQESWKRELENERKSREQLAQEVKEEALKRAKLAEDLSEISKERIAAETEIVSSFRKVVEQGAAFQHKVCQDAASEAVEQRTVLAKEIKSGLEATLEERLTDLRSSVERNITAMNKRCDACDDFFAKAEKSIEYLRQRCTSHEESSKADAQSIADLRSNLQAEHATAATHMTVLVEELQKKLAETRCYNDDIVARCSEIEQRIASVEQKLSGDAAAQDNFRRCQEMVATLRDELKEEVKERTQLGNRFRAEDDYHSKQLSTVISEVANVQQQMSDLRESLRLDMQSQLLQQKQASEDRLSSLISSLQAWQEKSIHSFEKQKIDVSTLREHMTEHLSWVAKDHETELSQLKTQVLNLAEQTKEVSAQISSLQESERMPRASDSTMIPRSSDGPILRQPSQIATVSRSMGSTTPARLRPVSPLRSMPQPPLMVPQKSSPAAPSTLSGDASIPINAGNSRNLPKPPDIGTTVSQGGLQRTSSAGLLSARVSGPPRNTRQT